MFSKATSDYFSGACKNIFFCEKNQLKLCSFNYPLL